MWPPSTCPASQVPASVSVFQAGLASPENSEQLIIALEPEAASIYCRKLRLHQMIELSSKAVANGYSASDTVGAGFAQGTSALSLPPSTLPSSNPWASLSVDTAKGTSGCEGQGTPWGRRRVLVPLCLVFFPAQEDCPIN